jgi:outer membrane protein assembly factor BamB/predicted Ser/Thr protein kinase
MGLGYRGSEGDTAPPTAESDAASATTSTDGLTTSSDPRADAAFDALLRQIADADDVEGAGDEPLAPGDRFGHFEVVAQLGRGGMGIVYLAHDVALHRHVALKVLHPAFAGDPDRRRRLLREARAAAAVSHPNIAAVHEVGEVDGRVFVAMEHVEGESLRAWMARSRPRPSEAAAIAKQILAGLGAAHTAGLIHRDLKPDNVMLARDGSVRLLDFGLAKRSERGRRTARPDELTSLVTRAGHVLGTPAYMSPEQAVGDPVDHRSDLFSFGVVLYELLVGRRPFAGTSQVTLMAALLGADPPPPVEVRPEVGAALSAVVMRCLAKQPEARFPDAASVARELDRAAIGAPRGLRRGALRAIAVALLALSPVLALAFVKRWKEAPPFASPRVETATTALGGTGAACRVGRDCVSGSCALDRCRPWSAAVAGAGADSLNEIAVAPDGQIVVGGWFRGSINLGCGPLSSGPSPEVANLFVARFKREGTCVWSRRVAFSGSGVANAVIPAANGNVTVLAEFLGEADFGGGPVSSRGAEDIGIFELDARGNHVWSRTIGGPAKEVAGGVRDPDGNLILYGSFASPSLAIGAARFTLKSPGYADAFVAKLSPTGEPIWARALASASRKGSEFPFFAAVDARGDIAVIGSFYDTLDLGGVTLTSAGDADTFVAKLSGKDGAPIWARRFGTAADEPYEGAVAFDAQGNVFLAGEHRGADLGGGPLPGTIYVAKLSPSGEHLWSRGFGGDSPRDCARRLVIDRDGAPVAFGRFLSAELRFDERRLTNAGGSDLFVARFDPAAGRVLGVRTFFATDAPVRAAAIDARTGNLFVGGRFEGTIDFGAGAHKAMDQDGYFASIGPAP